MAVSSVVEHAVKYAGLGLAVARLHNPLFKDGEATCSCGNAECGPVGKHPMTKNGYKDGTLDPSTIQTWFTDAPDANVGIVTGRVSGIFVLDVDPRNGGDKALDELIDSHGDLPDTWTVHTGGDGLHMCFNYPPQGVSTSHGKLGPGLDVQSDGAFVVAPPSRHQSGKNYKFVEGLGPDTVMLADAPEWLIQQTTTHKGHSSPQTSDWRQIVREGAVEGTRNSTVAKLAGHLMHKDVDAFVVLDLLATWNQVRCCPPLSDSELYETVNSIAGREFAGRQR